MTKEERQPVQGEESQRADVAEYALGLLPEEERAALVARLEAQSELGEDLNLWREEIAALVLREVEPLEPPPQMLHRLEAQLFAARRQPLWRALLPYALGGMAAGLVLWVAVALGVLTPNDAVPRGAGEAPEVTAPLQDTLAPAVKK